MGLEASQQLAAKGANVIIVARDEKRLQDGVEYIRTASISDDQRFHFITADLRSYEEATRVMTEATAWNSGSPPDIVWCCAGASHPSLFVDAKVSTFRAQMDSNYFSSVYMAHAVLQVWLKSKDVDAGRETGEGFNEKNVPRHLIFTGSFLSFYPVAGYSPYSPTRAAIRALSDQLSQEMNLYTAANPHLPPVKIHTVFPATMFTESYKAENKIKSDLTKMLEEADGGQTPQEVARCSIRSLEKGHELITTDMMTRFVMCSTLGASVRGGFWKGLVDCIMGCVGLIIMVLVRQHMDGKVRDWGKKYGDSGMKSLKDA